MGGGKESERTRERGESEEKKEDCAEMMRVQRRKDGGTECGRKC